MCVMERFDNLNDEQLNLIDEYCKDDMKKLKKVCNPIIIRIGGISDKDYDELYSLAQWILLKCIRNYDKENEKGCSFNTYLFNIMERRLYSTYIRDRNRGKRSNTKVDKKGNVIFIPDISLDAPTPDCIDILERLVSNNNVENEVIGTDDIPKSVEDFLDNVSKQNREIAEYIMNGYSISEIQEFLHITLSDYNDAIREFKSYENVCLLLGGREKCAW